MATIHQKTILESLLERIGVSCELDITVFQLLVQVHSKLREAFADLPHCLSVVGHLFPELSHLLAKIANSLF